MKTNTLMAALLALAAAAALGPARPVRAAAAPDVSLYDGKTAAQDNLSVGNWGGGTAEESTDLFLFGGHSLKITTLDPYQGAQITFAAPVTLAAGQAFQVTFRLGGATLHYDPQAVPGAAQNAPNGGRFGGPGGPFGGGFGGPGGPFGGGRGGRFGGFRGRGGRQNDTPLIPPITKLHLLFTLADGRRADAMLPIPEESDAEAGQAWHTISVPVSSLKFAGASAGPLKSVVIAGDEYGVIVVGRMRLAPAVAAP